MTASATRQLLSAIGAVKSQRVPKLCQIVGEDGALRNLTCQRVQVDEIWSFVGVKRKNFDPERHDESWGDAWTFVAMDADTKLVPSWLVGQRHADDAIVVLDDLRSRLASPVQLSTDGHKMYLTAVPATLGDDVDYGQVVKKYGRKPADPANHKYSPERCLEVTINKVSGSPDPAHISTSYVERQNLTIRMGMRRFTRLTNGFSRKVENLSAAVSLHFMHYNFARPHTTLTRAASHVPTTPAMAAGVADHVWTLTEIALLLDQYEHSVGKSN